MPAVATLSEVAQADNAILVLSIVVPIAGILLSFAVGSRWAERVVVALLPIGLGIAFAIFMTVWRTGAPLVYLVGGWVPPLGITLRADGLSAAMMLTTALVVCVIAVFAYADFHTPEGETDARAPFAFWILLLSIWGAMNLVCLGNDLFTLYVALELLTFSAVPLVCLDGTAATLRAALRYLLYAMIGAMLYLVGVALLYGVYGALDITILSQRVRGDTATSVAIAAMTAGLLAKTALFPLHGWLPPAHAGAPSAGSAALSALVVKGSFFIVVRLWLDVAPALPGSTGVQLLGALGAAAILFGSVLALVQQRLKLLVAYSTVAQLGYLFLLFPLAFDNGSGRLEGGDALTGGMLQALSHATAKAAMFMAVGLMYAALGHDRLADIKGIARALPVTVWAFALGGMALIGLPPSGGFLAKCFLLAVTVRSGQWWYAIAILAGGLLTSGYMVLFLSRAMAPAREPLKLCATIPRHRQDAVLALALFSFLLGLIALAPLDVLQVGRPAPIMVGSR
jgi:formate hydrogenlyase subunit 3/multisubunit Na+/H+ antiporter MnhD subunit